MSSEREAILDVRGLSMSFGSQVVLNNISFQVNKGEILGIMGESGGGKSTILKLIIGLLKPLQGEIIFEDKDLSKLSESELKKIRPSIGFVFQSGALFDSLSVFENIKYPLLKHADLPEVEMNARANERLKLLGLAESCQLFPSELSGGMQKRVGLIRATILNPSLILFDEPTAGMDTTNIQILIDKILELKKAGASSGIFVSHDFSVLRCVCDRIAFLAAGKIRAIGHASELEKSSDPVVLSFIQPKYQKETCGQAS